MARHGAGPIWLVRHGSTAPQEEGRYCGRSDPPLSPRGMAQMQRLAERLGPLVGNGGATVISSDRQRATASARILSGGPPDLELAELREIDAGAWEGLPFAETGCEDAERLRELEFCFPGGESVKALYERVRRALPLVQAKAERGAVCVVAHAGSLAALAVLLGQEPHSAFWDHRLPPGGEARLLSLDRSRWSLAGERSHTAADARPDQGVSKPSNGEAPA